MKQLLTAVRVTVMAGAMAFASLATAQTSAPDAPVPRSPQAPANQAPKQQNPDNQGGCYLPDASGKQVFVPNCGLSEAPQRRQPAANPAASDPARQFPFPGDPATQPNSSQTPQTPSQPGGSSQPGAAQSGTAPANPPQSFPFPGETGTPLVRPDGSVVPADAGGLKDAGSSGDSPGTDSTSSSSSSSSGSGIAGLPDDPDARGPLADDDTVLKKPRKKAPELLPQTEAERVAADLSVYEFYMDDANYRGAYLRAFDAVQHAADDPEAHFALAESARKLGKLDEALTNYKKTLELDPVPKTKKAAEKAVKQMSGGA